ncbi:serine hydrolase [Streptomyces sp. p1417]|uniref:Serine hydrolase n=1 Tax=Streptomyces typhae TaxID=2681492 RepID=A0A6L6WWG8_9ACTN|nr:serine hydrolase domain-containing protein [Streptomyces typhae]MVO84491.1 serine hydrolase [Streptomyces typhae]
MSVRVRTQVVGAAAVALGVLAAPASSASAPAADGAHRGHRATQRAMDRAVAAGVPGVTGRAVTAHGEWAGTSGVGDLRERTPRGPRDRYRVGSVTKTFVATVLLQLQAEGRLRLDDTVGSWLPGLVRGNGHDGDRITVRQLLNHTSGVFDYLADPVFQRHYATPEFLEHRYDTRPPEHWVRVAMRHRPQFRPGTGWGYSNTNYLLAGMVVERVTGHPYRDEVRRRIIEPLHLRATSLPGTRPTLDGPASRAYSKLSEGPGGPTYDVTELNPSEAGAAGEMISDSADLNRFYSALLRGRLLPARELAEMRTTVPATGRGPGVRYGLGLMRTKLSCGTTVWGHHGALQGSVTESLTTNDDGHSLSVNFNGDWAGTPAGVVEAEFCGKSPEGPSAGLSGG